MEFDGTSEKAWCHKTEMICQIESTGLVTEFVRMLVMSCQEGDRLTRCGELKVTVQVEGLAPCGLIATVVSKPGW